ncbi:pentatricopeptide repeat-containing protein At1g53600, mitochondrial [Tripterygium wilfordii]|uniref:pentatricopeptide repeat-containing protein At1g53600, mitochondrial n=1 Tax=Tripterygium wilfordii TaxID=458696 RepID=UPI0018F7F669|nr:pentatricopeptide repeat-containing protein At1g53600, mitochondrial [Tripterygium wilfordii]
MRRAVLVNKRLALLKSSVTLKYSNLSGHILSKPEKTRKATDKFLVFCNYQITKNGRSGDIKESESIFNRMSHKNTISWTAMLTAYYQNGKISEARKVFDEMPERSVASYNAMITAYVQNRCMIEEAFELFDKMPERNAVSYAVMITGFVRARLFGKAEEVYDETPVKCRDPVCSNTLLNGYLKEGRLEEAVRIFKGMGERDVVSWSSMVDGYCKDGRIIDARELFDRMPEKNVVTWTAMINGYMKIGKFDDGFGLFLSMRRETVLAVNATTMTTLSEACGSFDRYLEGIQMHGLVSRMGFEFDVYLGNSIITMYSRFGCIDAANMIFHMMSKKDLVSWNSLIAGHVQHGEIEEAYEIFQKAPEKDSFSWTTMITGFSRKRNTGKSIQLFRMMPERDDVAWTALISGFVNNEEYEEAFDMFIEMLQKAVKPNPLTLSSILSASADLATLNQGLQIHALVVKMDMENDLSIQNSLVSMYSKCGDVNAAYRIFTDIRMQNIISFNSMITGFSQNGYGEEALKLFKKMQNKGQEPNQITFLGVLSACSHVGLVEDGWKYFKLMKSLYDIEPVPDHYACMVDLFGRAGMLEEANDLINSMPFEPGPGVWGALLGAARTHSHLDLAKLAAEHIITLEPNSATPYVVLSNLYNMAGEKYKEDQVRMMQNSKRIRKSPGCSWIIVKDEVHLFLAGDQFHANFEDVKTPLWTMAMEMRELDFHGQHYHLFL